jgi:hypothetical protein
MLWHKLLNKQSIYDANLNYEYDQKAGKQKAHTSTVLE